MQRGRLPCFCCAQNVKTTQARWPGTRNLEVNLTVEQPSCFLEQRDPQEINHSKLPVSSSWYLPRHLTELLVLCVGNFCTSRVGWTGFDHLTVWFFSEGESSFDSKIAGQCRTTWADTDLMPRKPSLKLHFLDVYACLHVCGCACVWIQRPEVDVWCFLWSLSILFSLRQGHSLYKVHKLWLILISQLFPGFPASASQMQGLPYLRGKSVVTKGEEFASSQYRKIIH